MSREKEYVADVTGAGTGSSEDGVLSDASTAVPADRVAHIPAAYIAHHTSVMSYLTAAEQAKVMRVCQLFKQSLPQRARIRLMQEFPDRYRLLSQCHEDPADSTWLFHDLTQLDQLYRRHPIARAVRQGELAAFERTHTCISQLSSKDPITQMTIIDLIASMHGKVWLDQVYKNIVKPYYASVDALTAIEDDRQNASLLYWMAVCGQSAEMDRALRSFRGQVQLKLAIDHVTKSDDTALMAAARNGHRACVDLLLKAKADVTKCPVSPILIAARQGHKKIIDRFNADSYDLAVTNADKETALHMAAGGGHTGLIKFFLDSGFDVHATSDKGQTAIFVAADIGYLFAVKALHEAGADFTLRDNNGMTILMVSIAYGPLELIKYFLDAGLNVHDRDNDGHTALLIAAFYGRVNIAKELVQRGADIKNVVTTTHAKMLYQAARGGHTDMIQYLLDEGANIDATCRHNFHMTPLHGAAEEGNFDAVKLLLSVGAKVNKLADDGVSALCFAAKQGHLNVAQLLLETDGVQVNTKTMLDGSTPLMHAARDGHTALVKALCVAGADTNMTTHDGSRLTALYVAAYRGHADVVDVLLECGAQLIERDNPVNSAIDAADLHGHPDIADLLRTHFSAGPQSQRCSVM